MKRFGATVFFSYAAPDRAIVRAVADRLTEEGIRVWLDATSLEVGSDWVREIDKALDSADFIVFFISSNSVGKSGWAQKELRIALDRQVSGVGNSTITPVLLEEAEVPPLLRDIHWLDMTDGDVDKGVRKLVDTILRYSAAARPGGDT